VDGFLSPYIHILNIEGAAESINPLDIYKAQPLMEVPLYLNDCGWRAINHPTEITES